jgi:hypothetical protein
MARIETYNGQTVVVERWLGLDIEELASDEFGMNLLPDQTLQVMNLMVKGFDAHNGINWDTVKCCIEIVLDGRAS